MDKKFIVNLLRTNDKAIARALLALNERQTLDERVSEHTRHDNGRGFRPCHARMGTSMAKFFQRQGYLSPKQVAYWRATMRDGKMRIEIYAGQLLDVAQRRVQAQHTAAIMASTTDVGNREEAALADREMQQMEAEADRNGSRNDELNKFLAKCRMESV